MQQENKVKKCDFCEYLRKEIEDERAEPEEEMLYRFHLKEVHALTI